MIPEIMRLAVVTVDGQSSYPSLIPALLAIAGLMLAVAMGSKRFEACPKQAKRIYWIVFVGILIAFIYTMLPEK
jgi:uncharacterized membrane protein